MTTYLGTHITNFDSTPPLTVNSRLHGGLLKASVDTFELEDTGNNDTKIVFKLPIDAILHSVKFACDDLGSAGTADITFFKKNNDGTYTEIADGLIANNIDVNAAAVSLTEYRYSVLNIDTARKALWELAGLSARPAYGELYIGLTTDTGTTAVGTVTMSIQYTE